MYLYPLWIRIWHILNAILIIILIITGIMMQYAGPDNHLMISFFPGSLKVHNISAITLIISYIIYITGNIITDNGKYYKPERKEFARDIYIQLKYYVRGIFRHEKNPFPVTDKDKFNPFKKAIYLLAMYLALPLLILTGIIMLFPDLKIIRILGQEFYIFTDVLHIILGFVMLVFLIIHVYISTISSQPGSLFRGIMSGYVETEND